MPKFEVFDARIASELNRIIHNSHFERRISLEEQKAQKQDRFLRGRQIAYPIYDYFWVTGANDSVENYADLFAISFRNDDIQEFDSKWDGILLSMTKIPPDDILEGLYKLRIRESEKLKTVLELYDLEIHQKKIGPDDHRLKISIEQNLRIKTFEARNANYERNAVVKNPGQNSVYKEFLEIVGNGSPTGSVLEETIAVSATILISVDTVESVSEFFMQQNERNASRTRIPRGKSPSGECFDGLDEEWLQIWEKSARMHMVRLMNNLVKKSKKNDDKSAVAMLKKNDWHENVRQPVVNRDKGHERPGRPDINRDTCHELKRGPTGRRSSSARHLGCVFQDMKPPKCILRKSSDRNQSNV